MDSPKPDDVPPEPTRDGVVAIIRRGSEFLTIRRSRFVFAPRKICFPGGGIQTGESEVDALCRELWEELAILHARPLRLVWRSTTPRGIRLAWWLTRIPPQTTFVPCPTEVESVFWARAEELLADPDLLVSNRDFFNAYRAGCFSLEIDS